MKTFFKGFTHAFNGIIIAIKEERNMRFHLCVGAYVYLFSLFYELTAAQYATLTLVVAGVLAFEMVNSALERVMDKISPEYNKAAGIVKDVAAGAVLVFSIGAVACGVFLFWNISVFKHIFAYFAAKPVLLVLLGASLAGCWFFVFKFGTKKH